MTTNRSSTLAWRKGSAMAMAEVPKEDAMHQSRTAVVVHSHFHFGSCDYGSQLRTFLKACKLYGYENELCASNLKDTVEKAVSALAAAALMDLRFYVDENEPPIIIGNLGTWNRRGAKDDIWISEEVQRQLNQMEDISLGDFATNGSYLEGGRISGRFALFK